MPGKYIDRRTLTAEPRDTTQQIQQHIQAANSFTGGFKCRAKPGTYICCLAIMNP